jgi:hypothetical protein
MEAKQVVNRLTSDAGLLDDLEAPRSPGVYAYSFRAGSSLPRVSSPGGNPVYIGLSGNLAQREFDTHFAEGKTGFSTLRRSLGAILKNELGLRAPPRGTGASKANITNYRYYDEGERRQREWMHEHVPIAIEPVPIPDELEQQLIALACPPPNLKGWATLRRQTIRARRKACADEARRSHLRG